MYMKNLSWGPVPLEHRPVSCIKFLPVEKKKERKKQEQQTPAELKGRALHWPNDYYVPKAISELTSNTHIILRSLNLLSDWHDKMTYDMLLIKKNSSFNSCDLSETVLS